VGEGETGANGIGPGPAVLGRAAVLLSGEKSVISSPSECNAPILAELSRQGIGCIIEPKWL
jgi:hypothetical protein